MRARQSIALLMSILLLASCAPAVAPLATATEPAPTATSPAPGASNASVAGGDLVRVDQQGAVGIEVTPLNLGAPAATFEFDVSMNTHSVDLSMDLASLATLATNAGATVQAISWDGPRGGHHVTGKLVFPGTKDGKSILEGASKLTLTILNVDAAARVFEWALN